MKGESHSTKPAGVLSWVARVLLIPYLVPRRETRHGIRNYEDTETGFAHKGRILTL